ncbi:hypothetical protein [Fictibacillus barbaricus]|uniref:DUF4179 domain-containing protein n=1 Tax=Fictibacillus barbaricus TaxID=182136 RepID=A0ABS2ZD75_9BACL|nr:hypothetical protein [Fictibacillus barbaricus]MBN3545652.1 hypothetical protein [Fictibacillus barbaricus]GGB55090.1 hypothetical protein GCM10007199_21100 [Fictibacillus barbaricus]
MNKKWQKIIIGAVLLIGFVLYTQFEKNAEPVWVVNEKNFTVVDSLQDGMDLEYTKFDELERIDQFGFIKDSNKVIRLNEKYRTLQIEKVWHSQGQLYFLYSVDLKERDKDETDIPRLTVKKMKLHMKDGEEFIAPVHENSGNYSLSHEGFVYKHRLYRSLMIFPMPDQLEMENFNWEKLMNVNKIDLLQVDLADRSGLKSMDDIQLKVSSDNPHTKVIHSENINKSFTYDNREKAKLTAYEFLLYDQRLRIEIPDIDDRLVGFSGTYNDESYSQMWDLIGTEKDGFYLHFYDNPHRSHNQSTKRKISINASIHTSENFHTWTIPAEHVQKFNANTSEPVEVNQKVYDESDMSIVYNGVRMFDGSPKFSFTIKRMNDELLSGHHLTPERYTENVPEEHARSHKKNIISVTNAKKEELTNFEIFSEDSSDESTYYIAFYNQEDLERGEMNPVIIPEENLTVSLTDLTYSKPLPDPVTIQYELPKRIK